MNKVYPTVIAIVLAIVLGLYFFGPQETFISHTCNIQENGTCTVAKDGIELTLKISPIPIIPTEDLTYHLKVKGIQPSRVTMRVLGHDMEMPTTPIDEQVFDMETFLKKEEYQSVRTFPTCTEKIMIWRLYLVIQAEGKIVRTTFDLEVKRPS